MFPLRRLLLNIFGSKESRVWFGGGKPECIQETHLYTLFISHQLIYILDGSLPRESTRCWLLKERRRNFQVSRALKKELRLFNKVSSQSNGKGSCSKIMRAYKAVPIHLGVWECLWPNSSRIKYILACDFKGDVNTLWLQRPLWETLLKHH